MCKLTDKYASREPKEWGPLFHTILQRLIVDCYRRRAVKDKLFGWFVGNDHDDDKDADPIQKATDEIGQTPEQEMHSDRRIAMLDQAIRALPLRQQQAFLLRTLEGYDVNETARIMQCSNGSVKTHYSRAVNVLRKKLGDDW